MGDCMENHPLNLDAPLKPILRLKPIDSVPQRYKMKTLHENGTMKVLLDIPDKKADSLLDVLRHISYVKATPLTDKKFELLLDIREAVDEIKQIKAGEKSSRSARDFLDEL
jgi:hypothetical protein